MSLIRDTPAAVASPPAPLRVREPSLDLWRGTAILLMVVDHVTLLVGGPELIRLTLGRIAMPLFFILAGHLVASKLSWRHYGIAIVGAVLPLVVPWVDNPNVLVWYVMGAGILVLMRAFDVSPWWWVAIAAALAANDFSPLHVGTGYDGFQLIALMCVGALLNRSKLIYSRAGAKQLGVIRWLGRYPLSIYVGHLLALQLVATLLV